MKEYTMTSGQQVVTVSDDISPEEWFEYVEENGWGDGLPTIPLRQKQ